MTTTRVLLIALVAILLATATTAAVSNPMTALTTLHEDSPIQTTTDGSVSIAMMNALSTESNYLVIGVTLPNSLLNDWTLDFFFEISGGEFVGDIRIMRESISSTIGVYSLDRLESTFKTSKTKIQIGSLRWPVLKEQPTERNFVMKCKVKNIAAAGLQISGTSYFAVKGQNKKETFIPVVSRMALPLATMKPNWVKTNPPNKVMETVKAPVDITLTNIVTPSTKPTTLYIADQLETVTMETFKIKADEIKCTVNDKSVKASSTGSVLSLEIDSWVNLTTAHIKCDPETIMVDFHFDIHDQYWRIYTTDPETGSAYQTDLFVEYKLNTGWADALVWGLVAAVATLALFGIVFIILKVTKTGPFKPKERDQYSSDLLGNENQYQQF